MPAGLSEAMNIVETNYISGRRAPRPLRRAMDGMIVSSTPIRLHSPRGINQFQQQLEGEFVARHQSSITTPKRHLNVAEALIGKPAYMAGIRQGDASSPLMTKRRWSINLRDAVSMIRAKPAPASSCASQGRRGETRRI